MQCTSLDIPLHLLMIDHGIPLDEANTICIVIMHVLSRFNDDHFASNVILVDGPYSDCCWHENVRQWWNIYNRLKSVGIDENLIVKHTDDMLAQIIRLKLLCNSNEAFDALSTSFFDVRGNSVNHEYQTIGQIDMATTKATNC